MAEIGWHVQDHYRVRADRQAGSMISLFFSLETRLKKSEFHSIVDTGCCEQISDTNKRAFNLIFVCLQ